MTLRISHKKPTQRWENVTLQSKSSSGEEIVELTTEIGTAPR